VCEKVGEECVQAADESGGGSELFFFQK
jgi:hypothetical protein